MIRPRAYSRLPRPATQLLMARELTEPDLRQRRGADVQRLGGASGGPCNDNRFTIEIGTGTVELVGVAQNVSFHRVRLRHFQLLSVIMGISAAQTSQRRKILLLIQIGARAGRSGTPPSAVAAFSTTTRKPTRQGSRMTLAGDDLEHVVVVREHHLSIWARFVFGRAHGTGRAMFGQHDPAPIAAVYAARYSAVENGENPICEDDMPNLVGGCLCGEARYSASGEPKATSICHCNGCQKL